MGDARTGGQADGAGRRRPARSVVLTIWLGLAAQLVFLAAAIALIALRSVIGVAAAVGALLAGLAAPMLTGVFTMRWALLPLHRAISAVERLAAGEHRARIEPSGPAELRALAESINRLADESDRLRAELESRAELASLVRGIAARIRQHLDVEGVVSEAVTALEQGVGCDVVWILLAGEGGLALPEGHAPIPGLEATLGDLPPSYMEVVQELYRQRASYLVQDVSDPQTAALLPPGIRDRLRRAGAASMLVTPFGTGSRLLGELTLLRGDPGRPWSGAEVAAVESIASDVGRGIEHATLYAGQKELVEQLTAVDRAKSSFLAGITHDLRSPLTGIIGNVELLADDRARPLGAPQRQMVEAIGRNARRLAGLIDDLLAMSMIELGSFGPTLRPIDLADVLRAAVDEIGAAAREKGLGLEVSGPPRGLPVVGDALQLDRALVNVLGNAVKYTPAGGQVSVTAGRENGHAVIAVRDTGIGIPEADQASLFTRFFRASNAVTRAIPGTGLGLAIVRAIVDNHEGDVEVASREDTGTTVTIRLPMRAGRPPPGGGVAPGPAHRTALR